MMLSQHGVEDNAWLIALRRRSQAGNLASSSAPEDDNMKDWQLAVQLQQEFDVGSIDLTVRQPAESASSSTTTLEIPAPFLAFECGVCGELQNITKRIRLPDCKPCGLQGMSNWICDDKNRRGPLPNILS